MERAMEMTKRMCERMRIGHGLSLLLLTRGGNGPDMVHVAFSVAHLKRLWRRRRGSTSVAVAVSRDRVSWNVAEGIRGPVSLAHGIPFSLAFAHVTVSHVSLPN